MGKQGAVKGLRFTLPGAPDVPHFVPGVQGMYSPTQPTPVGGDGELTVEEAQALHDDVSVPLELVDVPDPAGARDIAAGWLDDARLAVRDAAKHAVETTTTPMERDVITDALEATSPKEGD